jgi:hypothetical protein
MERRKSLEPPVWWGKGVVIVFAFRRLGGVVGLVVAINIGASAGHFRSVVCWLLVAGLWGGMMVKCGSE